MVYWRKFLYVFFLNKKNIFLVTIVFHGVRGKEKEVVSEGEGS